MAIVKCPECQKEVSSDAASCPHCGGKVQHKESGCFRWAAGCATLTVASIFAMILASGDSGDSTPATRQGSEPPVALSPQLSPEEVARRDSAALAGKWEYSVDVDPMTSKETREASISSENTVDFSAPYDGPQRGRLALRTHPSYGKDVIFSFREGQILCSYGGCPIKVRFDESPARTFTAMGPADNSSNVIFIRNYAAFTAALRKAKVVRIQLNVYQEGAPTFEFLTGGFQPARYEGR